MTFMVVECSESLRALHRMFCTIYIGRDTQREGGGSSKAIVDNNRERFLGIYIVL